jgi:hypothetical protein
LEISYNDLEKGDAQVSNGIAFTDLPAGFSFLLDVINNVIKCFPGYGIVAEAGSGAGTLYNSSIIGNEVYDNGNGISIEAASPYNAGIDLFDNDAKGNHALDCADSTTGSLTLGKANTWFNNVGKLSSPPGLCTPVTLHDHDYQH